MFDVVPYETNRQLESPRMEPYDANPWASQAQMESRRIFEEQTMKSRLYWESHAKDCSEIEELRRFSFEETETTRHLRINELCATER